MAPPLAIRLVENSIACEPLTCELQVKITLFYYEMVNSVMAWQI